MLIIIGNKQLYLLSKTHEKSIYNSNNTIFFFVPYSTIAAEKLDDTFKVGLILSMTGNWSEFGEAQKQAVELAKKDKPDLLRTLSLYMRIVAMHLRMQLRHLTS